MRILFIHQGFPGQFVHLIRELKRREHEIWTITKKKDKSLSLKGINALYYNISRGNAENIHHLCREVESKLFVVAVANKHLNYNKATKIPT